MGTPTTATNNPVCEDEVDLWKGITTSMSRTEVEGRLLEILEGKSLADLKGYGETCPENMENFPAIPVEAIWLCNSAKQDPWENVKVFFYQGKPVEIVVQGSTSSTSFEDWNEMLRKEIGDPSTIKHPLNPLTWEKDGRKVVSTRIFHSNSTPSTSIRITFTALGLIAINQELQRKQANGATAQKTSTLKSITF